SSEAEAQKEGPATGEREGLAAQATSRVKSMARGLMEKAAGAMESGLQTAAEKLDEMAKEAPKVQERFAKQKASKVARGKTGKPRRPEPRAGARRAKRSRRGSR